jgi:hypothetical protein
MKSATYDNSVVATWGTRNPGGRRTHLTGYAKLKKEKHFILDVDYIMCIT